MKLCLILLIVIYFVITAITMVAIAAVSTRCENHYKKLEEYNEIKTMAKTIMRKPAYDYNSLPDDEKNVIDEYEYLSGLYIIRRNITTNSITNKSIVHEHLNTYCSLRNVHSHAESAIHAYIDEHLVEKHGTVREI